MFHSFSQVHVFRSFRLFRWRGWTPSSPTPTIFISRLPLDLLSGSSSLSILPTYWQSLLWTCVPLMSCPHPRSSPSSSHSKRTSTPSAPPPAFSSGTKHGYSHLRLEQFSFHPCWDTFVTQHTTLSCLQTSLHLLSTFFVALLPKVLPLLDLCSP